MIEIKVAGRGEPFLYWDTDEVASGVREISECPDPETGSHGYQLALNAYANGDLVGSAVLDMTDGENRHTYEEGDGGRGRGPFFAEPLSGGRDEPAMILRSLYVRPEARGKGVMRQLLDALDSYGIPAYAMFVDPALGDWMEDAYYPDAFVGEGGLYGEACLSLLQHDVASETPVLIPTTVRIEVYEGADIPTESEDEALEYVVGLVDDLARTGAAEISSATVRKIDLHGSSVIGEIELLLLVRPMSLALHARAARIIETLETEPSNSTNFDLLRSVFDGRNALLRGEDIAVLSASIAGETFELQTPSVPDPETRSKKSPSPPPRPSEFFAGLSQNQST